MWKNGKFGEKSLCPFCSLAGWRGGPGVSKFSLSDYELWKTLLFGGKPGVLIDKSVLSEVKTVSLLLLLL